MSLALDEPASLTEAEFNGVGIEACLRNERRGRDAEADATAAFVGEALDVSAAAAWLAVVEGELTAPSLGRRIFKVGVASVFASAEV